MSHSRIWSSIVVGAGLFLTVAATPAQAFTNPFSGFVDKAKTQFTKIYLVLPGDKPGKAVLAASAKASSQLKTSNYTADIKATVLDDENTEFSNATIGFTGPVKLLDPENPSLTQQDLALKAEVAVQGIVVKAAADMKVDGKNYYFKIKELPPIADFSSIKNKWLKVSNPALDALVPEKQTPEEKKAAEQALVQLVEDSEISDAKKTTVDGQKVFVVKITMPVSAIQKYIETIEKVSHADTAVDKYFTEMGVDPTSPEVQEAIAKSKADQKAQMAEVFAAMKPITSTITIDQKTLFIRQFELPLEVDFDSLKAADEDMHAEEPQMTPLGDLSKLKTLKLAIKLTMDKFNQPVEFSAPTDAVDFETAMTEMSASTYPTTQNQTRPQVRPIKR